MRRVRNSQSVCRASLGAGVLRCCLFLLIFGVVRAGAGTLQWDTDPVTPGIQGGAGTWDLTNLNWFNGSSNQPWNNYSTAQFSGTGGVVTVSTPAWVDSPLVWASDLRFLSPGYVLDGDPLGLRFGLIYNAADATINNTLVNNQPMIKYGAGALTLTGPTLGAGLTVLDGKLQAGSNLMVTGKIDVRSTATLELGANAGPYTASVVDVSGLAVGKGSGAFGSASMTVRGQVDLNASLASAGPIRVERTSTLPDPEFNEDHPLVDFLSTLNLNARAASAGPINVAGVVNLNAANCATGAISLDEAGRIAYNAPNAANGNFVLDAPASSPGMAPRMIAIDPVVDHVGFDTFHIGERSVLVLNSTRANLLVRGTNLTLDQGAVLAAPTAGILTSGVVGNLGTSNDVFYGVLNADRNPYAFSVYDDRHKINDDLIVGTTDGTTPWMGITSDGLIEPGATYFPDAYAPYRGRITGASNFVLQDVTIDSPSIRAQGTTPVTALVRGKVHLTIRELQNVNVKVEDGGNLLLFAQKWGDDPLNQNDPGVIDELALDHGSVGIGLPRTGSEAIRVGALNSVKRAGMTTPPSFVTVNTNNFLEVGQNNRDSDFVGDIGIAWNAGMAKVGSGNFTIAGSIRHEFRQLSAPFTLSGGSITLASDDVLQLTQLQMRANTVLDLASFKQTLSALNGAGTIRVNGGTLTLTDTCAQIGGPILEPIESTYDGDITGTGKFVVRPGPYTLAGQGAFANKIIAPVVLTTPQSFAGEVSVQGASRDNNGVFEAMLGILKLTPTARLGNISRLSLQPYGTLLIQLPAATGAGSPTGLAVNPSATVYLDGGTLRVEGPAGQSPAVDFGPLVPRAGSSIVTPAASAGQTLALSFASFGPRVRGATAEFSADGLGTTNKAIFKTPPPVGFINGATFARTDGLPIEFAKYDGAKGVVPFAVTDYSNNAFVNNKHIRLTASPATVGNQFDLLTLNLATGANPINVNQNVYTTLNLKQGGLIKSGPSTATIKTTAGGSSILTSSAGDLSVFTEGGDFTVGARITGGTSLTKAGSGNLILSADGTNTYSGPTYVNQGILELNKTVSNAAIPAGGVFIRGGILQLGRNDQIHDAANIEMSAGGFLLNNFNETVNTFKNTGGTFIAGTGTLNITTATLEGGVNLFGAGVLGASTAVPSGGGTVASDSPSMSGTTYDVIGIARVGSLSLTSGSGAFNALSTNTTIIKSGTDKNIILSGASVTVLAGMTLERKTQLANPTLIINGGGTLTLSGTSSLNFVNNSGLAAGTAYISSLDSAGIGTVNLGGMVHNVNLPPGGTLEISAKVTNGGIRTAGTGTLRLTRANALTSGVTISGGTIESADPAALGTGPVTLSGGGLTMRFNSSSTVHAWTVSNPVTVASDATLTVDETQPTTAPGKVTLTNALSLPSGTPTITSNKGMQLVTPGLNFGADTAARAIVNNNTVLVNGQLTGSAASITKRGTGTLRLAGISDTAQYAGKWIINQGTLELAQKDLSGYPRLAIKGASALWPHEVNGGNLVWLARDQINPAAKLQVGGAGVAAVANLNGFAQTLAGVTVYTGRGGQLLNAANLHAPINLMAGGAMSELSVGSAGVAVERDPLLNSSVLTTSSLQIANSAKLDLNDNALVVDYSGSASPIDSVRGFIASARGGTTGGASGGGAAALAGAALAPWSGSGLTSSAVLAAPADYALGYAEARDVLGAGGGNFMGADVSPNSVLVRFTVMGDANLDGRVNSADLLIAQNHLGQPGTWAGGDFDYDGLVSQADLDVLNRHLGQSVPAPSLTAGAPRNSIAMVPEPGAVAMILLLAGVALARRRKRSVGQTFLSAIWLADCSQHRLAADATNHV